MGRVLPANANQETRVAERFDCVVVGGGPGGYAAALYGAAAGLQIAMVEADTVGGTCLNRGCIPAKELLQTAEVLRTVRDAGDFGVMTATPTLDWAATIRRQGRVVDRLVKGVSGLLKKRKVETVNGFGRLLSAMQVQVGDRVLEADAIVWASGSAPKTLPGFEIDGRTIVTSDHALFLDRLPRSCAVIGGGVIGVEFASCFVDAGVEVTVLEALDSLVPGCDADVAAHLAKELSRRGADVRTGAHVVEHRPGAAGELVVFDHGGSRHEREVELVLVAVGRAPRTEGMGLTEAGVRLDARGFIEIDPSNQRTSLEGVWAVGDCVPTPALAHVAYAEAMVAVRDMLGEDPQPVDFDRVPWCVYTHPEVAWCGMTEAQASAAGYDVEVHRRDYAGVSRAVILGETRGFAKLVTDAASGRILGIHIIGPWATEQVVEGYLAANWDATVAELAHLVHPHPTLSEGIGELALAMTGRGLHG
jgi:dihydrolipoamide dehydrogenase